MKEKPSMTWLNPADTQRCFKVYKAQLTAKKKDSI